MATMAFPGEAVIASGGLHYWTATAIFGAAFALIVLEKIHKTKVALVGAALTLMLAILTQTEAFHSERLGIDYNVIVLLISMMVLVNIIKHSGIFVWTAIKCAKIAKGRPMRILGIFIVLTAIASAFLDNVTTVLLLAPVTLLIADELDLDPVPFLIMEALASNIGGTATLIGDPPNIIIASRAHLTFMDFLVHLGPAVAVMMVVFFISAHLVFARRLQVEEFKVQRILAMDEASAIKDTKLAIHSVVVLALMLIGFATHAVFHLEPATIALASASLLLLISRLDPEKILAEVEWPTIFFLTGLFVMVGGIVKVGLVADISKMVIDLTQPTATDMYATSIAVLWCSAILSAIVDNIPYVATMSPLLLDLANTVFHDGTADVSNLPMATVHHHVLMPVWWALSLGACLGGNGTVIGASANVVVLGIAEKSGVVITFLRFMAYGMPTMFVTVLLAHLYLWLRYY